MVKQLIKYMANYDSNYEIAQAISEQIGTSPIPFDSVYSIALGIYRELGGDESQFDSVYSILLEILQEVKESPNIIKDVTELPVAEENKNKIVRLSTDNTLYQSELISSETITTNKLPDEQQIDKAYLYEGGTIYYYGGSVRVILSDGELNWFKWYDNLEEPTYLYITETNAENIDNTKLEVGVEIDVDGWGYSNGVITNSELSVSDVLDSYASSIEDNGMCAIPAIYNAPESAQIGNAWIDFDSDVCYYTGVERETEIEGKDVTLYEWKASGVTIYTSKKPHNMYYQNADDGEGNKSVMCDWITYNSDISEETFLQREVHIVPLNAPDSEQMDNATISVYMPPLVQGSAHYSGNEISVMVGDVEISGYEWPSDDGDGFFMTTAKAEDIYAKSDCDFYMSQNGSVTKLPDMLITKLVVNIKKYQLTETIEEWDWVNIQGWKYPAPYRMYVDYNVLDSYDLYDWITAVLYYNSTDWINELYSKIVDIYPDGSDIAYSVLVTYNDGEQWVTATISPSINEIVAQNIPQSEYSEMKEAMLANKVEDYDNNLWCYLQGFAIYPFTQSMDFQDLELTSEDVTNIFQPLVGDDYIEEK